MKPAKERKREHSAREERFLKALGKKIGKYATERNKSIERLAYEAGVSKGYLYDLVKGQGNPSVVIIHRIASSLDLSISQLLK